MSFHGIETPEADEELFTPAAELVRGLLVREAPHLRAIHGIADGAQALLVHGGELNKIPPAALARKYDRLRVAAGVGEGPSFGFVTQRVGVHGREIA
jgi:hypothetical protein